MWAGIGSRPHKMKTAESSTSKQYKSLWRLGGLTPRQLFRDVFDNIGTNNLFGLASDLAFNFIFALFPLVLLMVTLFGLFASRKVELQTDFLSYFGDFLPPAAFELLKTTALEFAANASGGKLTFGIIFVLWFASGGVSSMISALNLAYGIREARSWIKVRMIALALTLVISVLLLAALLVVLVSGHFIVWLGMELRLQPAVVLIWRIIQWPAAIVFVLLSYSAIYYFGPDLKQPRWLWVSPGSAFGAFLWLSASFAFRVYLHFFNTYRAEYGSLGSVMILLVWLYVAGFAFLIGGEINAEIERAAARPTSE
jgi:membrane protein